MPEITCASEDADVASKILDPFTEESLGNRDTGDSSAATRVFHIMTGLLLSKAKNKDN